MKWRHVHLSIRLPKVSLSLDPSSAPPQAQLPAPGPVPYRSSCHQESDVFGFVSTWFLKANVFEFRYKPLRKITALAGFRTC